MAVRALALISFAAVPSLPAHRLAAVLESGAHNWTRTSDLFLTKEVLYRLSYVGLCTPYTQDERGGWSG